jgi:hypothetical protein
LAAHASERIAVPAGAACRKAPKKFAYIDAEPKT